MVIDLQHLQHLQHLFSKVVFHVFDLEVYGNAVAGVAGVATCGRRPRRLKHSNPKPQRLANYLDN